MDIQAEQIFVAALLGNLGSASVTLTCFPREHHIHKVKQCL